MKLCLNRSLAVFFNPLKGTILQSGKARGRDKFDFDHHLAGFDHLPEKIDFFLTVSFSAHR